MHIPKKITTFLTQLNANGHTAYVVGGAVRDLVLGIKPKDWDLATSATPAEIKETFAYLTDVKQIDASFPVVVVDGIEIATYRFDLYENGETIGTTITDDILADLARRDLTINAMAMSHEGSILDPYDGRGDLEKGIIDFVGLSEARISEDPCRAIRACRFLATIEGEFSEDTVCALIKSARFVKENVAPERLRTEIFKAMGTKKPSLFFKALKEIGLLWAIFPSLDMSYGADHGQYHSEDIFEHMMGAGDAVPESINRVNECFRSTKPMELFNHERVLIRLAAFLHDVGKTEPNFKDGVIHFYDHEVKGVAILEEELKALTFSTREIKFITSLVLVHMRGSTKMAPKTTRKLIKKFVDNKVNWKHWLVVKISDRAGAADKADYSNSHINRITKKFNHELDDEPYEKGLHPHGIKPAFEHKELAISGTTIRKILGIGPSQFVGVALDYLMKRVIDNPNLNTREELEYLLTGKRVESE